MSKAVHYYRFACMSVQADRRDAQRSRQEWSSRLLSLEQQLHESEHGERRAREEARQARQEAEAARRAVAAIADLEVRMIPLAKHCHAHRGWSRRSSCWLLDPPSLVIRRQAGSESVACGGWLLPGARVVGPSEIGVRYQQWGRGLSRGRAAAGEGAAQPASGQPGGPARAGGRADRRPAPEVRQTDHPPLSAVVSELSHSWAGSCGRTVLSHPPLSLWVLQAGGAAARAEGGAGVVEVKGRGRRGRSNPSIQ